MNVQRLCKSLGWIIEFLCFLNASMTEEALLDKVQELSDLELAVLLCLVAQEHCIIDTEPDSLDDLVLELQLVCRRPIHSERTCLFNIFRSLPMCLA